MAAGGLSLAVVLTAMAGTGAAEPSPPTGRTGESPTVTAEYFPDPHGGGRTTEVPANTPDRLRPSDKDRRGLSGAERAADGTVHKIAETGSTDDRLDVVLVGDGYTAEQQQDFLDDARTQWDRVTGIEPYRSYEGLFNVWAVEAVSRQSGISGDPTADVVRDTALGAHFWCDDIERLICTDLDRTAAYADKAPAADLVIMLANTTKYGGAGYSGLSDRYEFSGVSTLSSDNVSSTKIAVHEIGHSIGLLADEYTYPDYGTYQGPEPDDINASTHNAARMRTLRTKWHHWLGEPDPSGGTVGTYEGSAYYPRGLNRPTQDSLMRTLSSDAFNLPSREALIAGFYRYANPATAVTPTGTSVPRGRQLSITLAPLTTDGPGSRADGLSDLRVRWYVDGREARQARGDTTVVPRRLGVPANGRTHRVTAVVTDTTTALRDPEARKSAKERLTWKVTRR